jgi:hypothetical protein
MFSGRCGTKLPTEKRFGALEVADANHLELSIVKSMTEYAMADYQMRSPESPFDVSGVEHRGGNPGRKRPMMQFSKYCG